MTNLSSLGTNLTTRHPATSTQCGMAPSHKAEAFHRALGLPGRQMTSALPTAAARLRERIAFW